MSRIVRNQSDSRPLDDIGELNDGSGNALHLSPDGRHLLSVFTESTFSIWEVPTLTASPHHPLPMSNFSCGALAREGKLAAFVAKDGHVVFWHAETGQTNWFAQPITNASYRAVFSRDGARLAVAGTHEVCVMD